MTPAPFVGDVRRNLVYHVWPVRGEAWRWNVGELLRRIDLFNGRRIVGVVYDEHSEAPDAVREALGGHGCEFVTRPNDATGENVTFPVMLEMVRSLDPNEVTFYAHAKGVRRELEAQLGRQVLPLPGRLRFTPRQQDVRRWAEAMYRVNLDDWDIVRRQLERFAMTGAFKLHGRFSTHRSVSDWHYSGTFFWLRHAAVFSRCQVVRVPDFYTGVEAWPGTQFRRDETGCLFAESPRRHPHSQEFWKGEGDAALAAWDAARAAAEPGP